jgi:hypothetical protein
MPDAIPRIDIEELRAGFKGKPFHLLVETHIKRGKDKANLWLSAQGTAGLLAPSVKNLTSGFIDRWNKQAIVYDPEFWQSDTSAVFARIIEDARSVLSSASAPTDDETLFYFFQIVVLNYAYCAVDQPSMRKFMKEPQHLEWNLVNDKIFQALALSGGMQSSGKTLERAVERFEKVLNKTLPNWRDMTAEEIADTPQGKAGAAVAVNQAR